MLTAGMSARDVARHFQHHETTLSRLLNRFQQTGNVADRPGSGRPRKITLQEDSFLTTSSRRNGFLSSRKLGRLLRYAISTRVCDRTVRNGYTIERAPSLRWHSADVTSMCCSGLQDHRISLPLSTNGTT